jgi:seryl-tRNA(Sec) selenium transferase
MNEKEKQVHGWLSNLPRKNLQALASQHGVKVWKDKANKSLVREIERKPEVKKVALEMIEGGIKVQPQPT